MKTICVGGWITYRDTKRWSPTRRKRYISGRVFGFAKEWPCTPLVLAGTEMLILRRPNRGSHWKVNSRFDPVVWFDPKNPWHDPVIWARLVSEGLAASFMRSRTSP